MSPARCLFFWKFPINLAVLSGTETDSLQDGGPMQRKKNIDLHDPRPKPNDVCMWFRPLYIFSFNCLYGSGSLPRITDQDPTVPRRTDLDLDPDPTHPQCLLGCKKIKFFVIFWLRTYCRQVHFHHVYATYIGVKKEVCVQQKMS